MTTDYEWPSIGFTKYKIRLLHALKDEERDCKELRKITGYSGNSYQVKKYIVEEALSYDLVCRTEGDLYSLTEKGEWVLDQLMDYRDLDVLDARKTESKEEKTLEW